MRLLVHNGDIIGAWRRAYLGEIISKNRFKSKMLAQIRGRFGRRFTAADGTECVSEIYLKTGGKTINWDLIKLLKIKDTSGIRKRKVHPVWIYFAPGVTDEDLTPQNRAVIEKRVRELVEKYDITGVTIHWRREFADRLDESDEMAPDWWKLAKGDAAVAKEDSDEVNLIGQIMFDAHKSYKGKSCEAWGKSRYTPSNRFYDGQEVCLQASYTVAMDADAIVKAVNENIDGKHDLKMCRGARRGGCGGGWDSLEDMAKRYKTERPIRPGEELAYHILYKSDATVFYYEPGTWGRTGVSIRALEDMTSSGFIDFMSRHMQVDYHYHKSTWEKIKGFVMHLLAFASILIGAWQLTVAFNAATAAYEAAIVAGASTATAVWEGLQAFVLTMAGESAAEFFGTDMAAGTYVVGLVNTYSTIETLAGIGATPKGAVRTTKPEQTEQSTDVEFYTDSFVDAMMPDAQIESMMSQFEI